MMEILRAIQTSSMSYRLGWVLLHTLWLGLIAGAGFAVAMRLLRRRSANVRYLVACAALVGMVLLPAGVYVAMLPREVQPVTPAPLAATPAAAPVETPADRGAQTPAPDPWAEADSAEVTASLSSAAADHPWVQRLTDTVDPALPWVVLAWAVGVAGLSVWQVYGWLVAQWLRYQAVQPVERAVAQTAEALRRAMRVRAPVTVLQSMRVAVPMVIGWLRPAILLPVGLATGLTREQIEAILAHELAHVRRYDYLVNLLQSLAETLLFYHPVVWIISSRIRTEREHCCDDMAVAAGAEALCYAESLLQVARCSSARPHPRPVAAPALGATGRPSRLRSRITRLLSGEDPGARYGSWPLAATVLAAVVASACLLNNACAPPPDQSENPHLQVKLLLPEGHLAYLAEAPRISIQPHRYVSWNYGQPAEGMGTVHRNAVVATSLEGPLRFAVAIDADRPDAPDANVVRINTSGELDFHQAVAIPLRQSREGSTGSYAFGPSVTTLQVDGQTIPVTLRGEYVRLGSQRSLKLGLECVLEGLCRFGDRVLPVRVADGDGNGRIGDLVVPMRRGGQVVGRTPGDTVNIDLGGGAFAEGSPLIRAMYGQPVYVDGAWWDVRITSDRRNVYAHRLAEGAGRVRIHNRYWEAMFIGTDYVSRQYYDPSDDSFPLPPGRYTVMRYKQWTEPDMSDPKPAVLIESPFGRNGPFLLKGDEATFQVAAGQMLDLPLGTPFKPNLTVAGDDRSKMYRFSCRVKDGTGSTPDYIRTAAGYQAIRIAVAVLDRDGTELSQVLSLDGSMTADGVWLAPASARGPFTAVATLECNGFATETQRVTFGPAAAEAAAGAAPRPGAGAALSAPVRLVTANLGEQTYTWRIERKVSARIVYGVLEDVRGANPKRIVTAYEGGPESSVKDYTLVLTHEGGKLKVAIRDQYHPSTAGGKGTVVSTMPWPEETELVNVSLATAADLTGESYLALWEGAFLRDGQEVQRITFVARLAGPQDSVTNILGRDDTVRDILPSPDMQRTDAAVLRFLQQAELEARLVADHAAALEDLGPNHRTTATLRDLLEQAQKERREAQASLTRQQREQLLTRCHPTGPAVFLQLMEEQLKAFEAKLGPSHRNVKDLRRRVEAVRQLMRELEQELQSEPATPTTAPAPR